MPSRPESDPLARRLARAGVATHLIALDPAALPAGVEVAGAEAALATALAGATGTAVFRLAPFRYALALAPEMAAALPARLPWPGAARISAIPAEAAPDPADTRLAGAVAQARVLAGPQAMLLLEAGLALEAAATPPRPDAGALRGEFEAALRAVLGEGPALPPGGEAARILAELGNQRMMLNGLRAALREIDRSLALGPRLAAPRPLLDRLERLAALVEAEGAAGPSRPAPAVSPAGAAR